MTIVLPISDSRTKQLKAATAVIHDRLDAAVMAYDPFSSLDRYARFVRAQWAFHAAVAPLYAAAEMQALIPDLGEREKLTALRADMLDLVIAVDERLMGDPLTHRSVPHSLGWLYVVEGSSLGAAFLFKAVARLGLEASHGARHLAGHPDGRAVHWRRFTQAVDHLSLTPEQDTDMAAAARQAFARFRTIADAAFA